MDAVEFLKERKRMCLSFGLWCSGCPLNGGYCANTNDVPVEIYEKNVETVEQWAKEHPNSVKTRQTEFLKLYPNAQKDENDILYVNPCVIDTIILLSVLILVLNAVKNIGLRRLNK